jgi:hypothetical protein
LATICDAIFFLDKPTLLFAGYQKGFWMVCFSGVFVKKYTRNNILHI